MQLICDELLKIWDEGLNHGGAQSSSSARLELFISRRTGALRSASGLSTFARCNKRRKQYVKMGAILLVTAIILRDLLSLSPCQSGQCYSSPLTGKPDAGNPPVRSGGRGGLRAIP